MRIPNWSAPIWRGSARESKTGRCAHCQNVCSRSQAQPTRSCYMAQARHIGKIVLCHHKRGMHVSADASYLVTGGMGGLGLQVAKWLAARGARNIVLMGRSAPSEQAREAIEQLRQSGSRVDIHRGDASQRGQVDALLRDIRSNLPPLRGICSTLLLES